MCLCVCVCVCVVTTPQRILVAYHTIVRENCAGSHTDFAITHFFFGL